MGHRIIFGDARDEEVYRALLGGEQAAWSSPILPITCPIDGMSAG